MSPWLLLTATLAIFAAVLTGRVWLILLAMAYASTVLGIYFAGIAGIA